MTVSLRTLQVSRVCSRLYRMMAEHHSKLQMMVAVTSLIISLMCLEVHSQTSFPSIALRGTTLHNNSWIDITALGDDKLQCVTDLDSCCEGTTAERAWILPNGTELREDGVREISSLIVFAVAQEINLKILDSRNAALPGVYECSIATRAAAAESLYVGIYSGGANVGEYTCHWRNCIYHSRMKCMSTYC